MSHHRLDPRRGWAYGNLPKGPNGRNLCRECHVEVPPGRQTFCSKQCVEAWKIRSDPTFVRIQLFERDKGICAICGVDCVALTKELEKIEGPVEYWTRRSHRYEDMVYGNIPLMARLKELSIPPHRYQRRRRYGIWDADHIVPVVEGGGLVGISGFRTLCCRCHKNETAALKRRLAEQRKLAAHQNDSVSRKPKKMKLVSHKLFE